jgi:hypothetical protein
MSYSRRQLYAMGEPLGDDATRRAVGGKVIYGSGGGGGNAEKQTTIVDLPEWAKPYAKESLGKAAALTSSPYQTYGGERTAQFSPLQKQAFDAAAQQQVAGQIGQATGLAGLASQQALGAGDFQTGVFDAERVGTSSFAQPGEASRFMSPYMDAVVQRQMESAQRQADIAGTQRGAQAVRAGAFGGSRQAVENAEAARALASQKGEIQAQGLQSAFQQAQSQFNQEQDARMRAAMANQQAGFEAQRATEQSRQFGSNIGLQGAQTALQGAGQLGQLGQQQFGQQMGITDLQQQLGGQQRAATQDILSTQYQDFLNQQRAPFDQLSFMSSIIRGTPMGQTTTQYQPPASPTSQLLGLGIAGAGAYGAYQGAQNRAAGGEVKGYAAGGIASLNQPEMAAMAGGMSDEQLQETQGLPSITQLAQMTLQAEEQQRAQMRAAQQAQMVQKPQGTVADGVRARISAMEQGIGGLDVPDDLVGDEYTAAGGGIVAFAPGGGVDLEKQREEDRARFKSMYESGLIGAEEFSRALLDIGTLPARGVAGALDTAVIRPLRAAGADIGYMSPYLVPEGADPSSMTPFYDKMRSTQVAAPAGSSESDIAREMSKFRGKGPQLGGITDQPPAVPTPKDRKQVIDALGAAAPNLGAGAAPSGGLAGLLKDIKTRETQLRDEAKQASDIEAAGLEKERTALEAAKEEAKKYGTDQEEKYKKRGERLDKAEKGNIYQTMMEAGLAIAAGESPNALKNLAVGAQQGLKGYQGRLEKVNEGRDGLEDAMFKLYNIRNDKVTAAGDKLRELGRAETEAKAKAVRSLSEISKGMFGEEMKVKTKEIDRAFDVWKTKYEQGQATARAKISAESRPDPTLKDPRYKSLADQLSMEEMMLSRQTDPTKKLATQERIADIQRKMNALTGGGGGTVTGSSTLPPGFVPDK